MNSRSREPVIFPLESSHWKLEVTQEGLSKNIKAGLKGTSINERDAKEIIDGVQAMYEKVPPFLRPMLPSLPDVLRRIPASAGKYPLGEIILLLDWAYQNGHLKR